MENLRLLFAIFFLFFAHAAWAQDQEAKPTLTPEEEEMASLLEAAESGDAESQFQLGMLYYKGSIIPQDYEEATKWFGLAAEQGNVEAQFRYGCLIYYGRGIDRDLIKAHMWFNLAASEGNKASLRYREMVAEKMTPKEIVEAQKLAREWKPKEESSSTSP